MVCCERAGLLVGATQNTQSRRANFREDILVHAHVSHWSSESSPAKPLLDLEDGAVFLPGDLPPRARLARMMRVDQAGEHGAVRIYGGQKAVIKDGETAQLIAHMAEQEEVHYRTFNGILCEREVRPSLLAPFWHQIGFAMGYCSALLGNSGAMACTVAVEEVIDAHYAHQLEWLRRFREEESLLDTIERFQAEEAEHREIGLDNEAEEAVGYSMLTRVIKGLSRLAITIAERL